MGKYKKIKGQRLKFSRLRSVVFQYLKAHPDSAISARKLIKVLKIANSKNDLVKVLVQLARERKIAEVGDQQYAYVKSKKVLVRSQHEGIVDMTRSGSAYIVSETLSEDPYVPARSLNSALHGDRVLIEVDFKKYKKPRGRVIRVLERATEHFIGIYNRFRDYGIVTPDQMKARFDIFVPSEDPLQVRDGDKVVVRIVDWTGQSFRTPVGKITHVLGEAGSHDVEMQSILVRNGFDLGFSDAVNREVEALPDDIQNISVDQRRDFRDIATFTIDPEDAKDFDDALSVRDMENGDIEVGIHIADVTHFVKPGTALDKEAYQRSTSVYLVDRVLPMLPEKLSNHLCSLRPDEDSLCFSAVFVFDSNYRLKKRWFGKTIIHSQRRFSYDEAREVLDSGEGDFAKELRTLNAIAGALRKRKLKNGALVFETDEVRFSLDPSGVPVEIYIKERHDAHMLIEDFMLLANKEVARYMSKKGKGAEVPFIYRIHDTPDPDKLKEFSNFAKEMGFQIRIDTPKQISRSFNKLAKASRKDDRLKFLEPMAIRTMAKAEYNTDNIGHYGLAFEFYTHFTSPIRRYSDVLAHRILHQNLKDVHRSEKIRLSEQCQHISNQERKAQAAERESVKLKQVEYLQQFIGETFEGIISGMIDRGIFVELRTSRAEGMISFETLHEPFEIDQGRLRATGLSTGKQIRIGDIVQVKVVDANPASRQIDLRLDE